ncbi:hypothetical protein [Sphingobacterium daejeonense]|uniref:hypothetical protein n=1 Tax=Sphingobacterium daejeonense TaxID=371142 RepID=UPI0010C3A2AA|nr:hypothetical protein [Sphingobacterium daejeonense]VTP97740.1 Uncharacterised protein [Sphingobacterium daejeonense]
MPSCKSLTALAKSCGKTQGGATNELYLIAYDDLTKTNGKVYTEDTTKNMISAFNIGAEPNVKKFVKVGVINNSLSFTGEFAGSVENNSFGFDSTVNFNISGITAESRAFVQNLAEVDSVVAVIKLKSGHYLSTGFDGYMSLATASMQSGLVSADLNGFTISLSETGGVLPKLVDPTVIDTII